MLKGLFNDIKEWTTETAKVLRREFSLVFGDIGVLIFFFFLPLMYPIVYASIYNTEVSRDIPVAVVDNCRSSQSREFIRHADATQAIKICGYAANISEARQWMNEKKCYGILEIPSDYSEKIGRGEQGVVQFYSEMSLLLRYRTFLSSLTELQMATDAQIREQTLASLGQAPTGAATTIQTESFFLGDPQQGFASFVLPGILIMIIQQSMILGITLLAGTSNERRRRNRGYDPLEIQASPSAIVIGKTLCYTIIYFPVLIYVLHFIPTFFSFPHIGDPADYFLFMLPLLISSALLGQTLQPLISERESSFVVIVFTSVLFLFLSGLSWPRFTMQPVWTWLGNFVPATWGVEGFIRINNNGATLAQQARPYHWLWLLSAIYFVTAYIVNRIRTRHG